MRETLWVQENVRYMESGLEKEKDRIFQRDVQIKFLIFANLLMPPVIHHRLA